MNLKKLFGFRLLVRDLILVVALFAILLLAGVVRAADQRSFPPLPAGYEQWPQQQVVRCTVTKEGGAKGEYELSLYQRDLPAKGLFNAIEIHRLDGMPYLVSHFVSRHVGQGSMRGDEHFFIWSSAGGVWQELIFSDAFVYGVRQLVGRMVDRDFLSLHGTSTNEIKDCLRKQSRNNPQ